MLASNYWTSNLYFVVLFSCSCCTEHPTIIKHGAVLGLVNQLVQFVLFSSCPFFPTIRGDECQANNTVRVLCLDVTALMCEMRHPSRLP
uniref:Secreted protein n=1 Tax=Arundo donax TaxID=35708 RepID=A0A0A9D9T5_ARUDO